MSITPAQAAVVAEKLAAHYHEHYELKDSKMVYKNTTQVLTYDEMVKLVDMFVRKLEVRKRGRYYAALTRIKKVEANGLFINDVHAHLAITQAMDAIATATNEERMLALFYYFANEGNEEQVPVIQVARGIESLRNLGFIQRSLSRYAESCFDQSSVSRDSISADELRQRGNDVQNLLKATYKI